MTQPDFAHQITGQCLLGRTRYLARVLTSIYDEELRPFGLQASQVTTLAAIVAYGPVRRRDIGAALHFDSSTLTRNLRVMLDNGWIEEIVDAEDARSRPLVSTEAGRALIAKLGPAWRTAQGRAETLLGDDGKRAVRKLFDDVQTSTAA